MCIHLSNQQKERNLVGFTTSSISQNEKRNLVGFATSSILQGETSQINLETREETIHLITPEFPYMTNLCDLHNCPDNTFPWHWHNEVEFFYMREGELTYSIPSGNYVFKKGEGGFINSNILHMTQCQKHFPCVQEEHIFLPQFIGGSENSVFMRKYIVPIISNGNFEMFRLNPNCKEHKKIIELMKEAYDIYIEKLEGYEFDIREKMSQIWKIFYELTKEQQMQKNSKTSTKRIKIMMQFITKHYKEKLTLQQIADASFISVRECCRCFKENLNTTPFSYLIDYRLFKACELLSNTSMSITEIALFCGFGSSSYFSKLFKAKFHCTPKEYRK